MAVATAALGVAAAVPARASVPVLVVEGDGWGHGVGMAQDGAFAMATDGATTGAILGQFYGGTRIGRATGNVRVVVLVDADRDTVVELPNGGEVRSNRDGSQSAGFPIRVGPGGAVRVRFDGQYHATLVTGAVPARSTAQAQDVPVQLTPTSSTSTTEPTTSSSSSTTTTVLAPPPGILQVTTSTTTTTTTAPPSPTTPPAVIPAPATAPAASSVDSVSANPLWVVPPADGTVGVPDKGSRYRGVVQVADGDQGLRLVDEVDVEQYLRGMGEMPSSWPRAALSAQAIASRTYAIRAMRASGELCDDERCQVYLGQQAEHPASDAAVRATAGQVLTYGSALASTVFSANGGGISAAPSEGFGTPDSDYPYLRAMPYPTKTPDHWETRIALADLAPRLGYPGQLAAVTIAAVGPSGRPTTLALDGSAGPRTVPALRLSHSLGLRSTKWVTRADNSDAAPTPPPEAELVQALPEEAATAAETPSTVAVAGKASVAAAPHRGSGPDRAVPVSLGVALLILLGGLEAVRRARPGGPTD